MYGGNGKTLEEVAAEVKRSVIGQDGAVDWLCSFVDAACARSRLIVEEGMDALALPNIGSALLVGPTASGKSHLLKTFAREAGLLYHPIDAGQMTGEGWRGNSFSSEWLQVSCALEENPGRNVLVFVDEVDKMFAQKREGSAAFDLLKPLEGGKLPGRAEGMPPKPYVLDCDRCVFVLAGAFTGIEGLVAARLGAGSSPVGFAAPTAGDARDLSEADLRKRVSLDDIEQWGVPREIVGRLSTIRFLAALGEDALRQIVRGSKQVEYAGMLPAGSSFSIDGEAEDLLVANALAAHYGARSINRQINAVFFGELWRRVSALGSACRVTLTARAGELDFAVEALEGAAVPATGAAESERLSARAAYGLLREVRERLFADGGRPSLDPRATLGEDCAAFAAALLCRGEGVAMREEGPVVPNNYSLAEVVLLYALVALVRDWFPAEDHTPQGLRQLLSLADGAGAAKSPLDLLFYQLESGLRYAPCADGDAAGETGTWAWVASRLVRNGDGRRPADTGGLAPGEDRALDYYTEFKGYPEASRRDAVRSLAFRLL